MTLGTINQGAAVEALQAELDGEAREFERVIDLFEHVRPHPATGLPDQLHILDAIDRLARVQARRSRIRANFAAIGATAPEAPDPADEIWTAIDATGRIGELRWHLKRDWLARTQNALKRLGHLEWDIDRLTANPAGSDALERIRELAEQRDRLAAGLDALKYDPGQKQRRVDEAIEGAGGSEALADCARSALQYLGRFEDDAGVPQAEAAVREAEAALARIDPKTLLGAHLKARIAEAKAKAKQTKAAREASIEAAEAALKDLIDRAGQADDDALETLEELVGEVPEAFPETLGPALDALDEVTDDQLKGALAVIVADR